jgi:hypothetical protein
VLADIAANAEHGENDAPISSWRCRPSKRINAHFDVDRKIDGRTAEQRLERR